MVFFYRVRVAQIRIAVRQRAVKRHMIDMKKLLEANWYRQID
ncbi:uncharacterized protein METZ01_LOCUS361721 [marine metagenome]|uniref:Uncharacterized protein n=1 Tax=marine metagenome TaxID=408172 RepID=A0A382SI43_9ZZZZ